MAFRDGLRWESGRTEKSPALAVGSCHSPSIVEEQKIKWIANHLSYAGYNQ